MICKFYGGPKQFTNREMDVDTSIRTYTLWHRGIYYPYDKTRYIEDGEEVISYLLRGAHR